MSDTRTLASGEVVVARLASLTLTTQRVFALKKGRNTDLCEAVQLAKVDYTALRRKHNPVLLVLAVLLGLVAAKYMLDGEDAIGVTAGLGLGMALLWYWLTLRLELVIGTGGGGSRASWIAATPTARRPWLSSTRSTQRRRSPAPRNCADARRVHLRSLRSNPSRQTTIETVQFGSSRAVP